jgi:amino acid adenylation domain-containing protein
MPAQDGRNIDGEQFQILANAEEQHSLWPAALRVPDGWTPVGKVGSKDDCLAYVDAHWTDMRPRSVRAGNLAMHRAFDLAGRADTLTHALEAVGEAASDIQFLDLPQPSETEPTSSSADAFDPSTGTLPDLFEMQVREAPQAIALIHGEQRVCYADLDESGNRLARYLASQGIGPGCLVAIALPRSIDMIVAMLGVLKAGAGYVPLDPGHPPRRLEFMLNDSAAIGPIINRLTSATLFGCGDLSRAAIALDDPALRQQIASLPSDPLSDNDRTAPLLPGDLAYVIYTSGSTGTPKGVAVAHASVVNLALRPGYVEIGPDDVLLHAAPFSFDASVFEIWGALLNGASLVLAPGGPTDLDQLAAAVDRHGVTIAWLTAGLFEQVTTSHLSMLGRMNQLLVGGDVVSTSAARRVMSQYPMLRLTNGYGPTETTTFACTHPIVTADVDAISIPIGRPIDNVETYVLDAYLWPARVGKQGELYVAGAGLARGYFGRPGLTAERFLACPFGPPGSRMYRTGDFARRRADGTLEFRGRTDSQVKFLGFRIEPAEIESALLELPDIVQARVRPGEIAGESRLVAYLVARAGAARPATSELRRALAERLPDYMVPATFVFLHALPLTPNGKLDVSALPAPDPAVGSTDRAPLDANEALLCNLFAELSGAEHVGPNDNFFELGGHSLVAVRLVARLRQSHGFELPLRALFEHPTPAGMARLLRNEATTPTVDEEVTQTDEPVSAELPDESIHGHRFVLRRARNARSGEEFRGILMCMPLLGGGSHYADIVALSLHDGYEIWRCSFDLQHRESPGSEAWIECAQSLVDWLLQPGALRPSAFLGFSIGGYVSWLVDRLLVANGRPVTPIISLEGGALPAYYTHLRSRISRLLPGEEARPRPRILLLHRETLGGFVNPDRADEGWRQLGVKIDIISCRTIRHLDFLDHRLLSAYGDIFAEFLVTGTLTKASQRRQPLIPTIGGKLYDLLTRVPPPVPDDIRAMLHSLPDGPVDSECRLAVLFLSMASGDAALALEAARRITTTDPDDRNAHYAQVAVLAELGRADEALAVCESWCEGRKSDPVMRQRAKVKNGRDIDWERRRWLFFSGTRMEKALDVAAARCAPVD